MIFDNTGYGIILKRGGILNKRIAYPIFIIMTYILINVGLRLLDFGFETYGASIKMCYHIFNVVDISIVMFVPTLLLVEQRDNPTIKKYFNLYGLYVLYTVIINILALEGIIISEGALYSVPLYLIILATIYIGYQETLGNKGHYRIGRSMIAAGVVHLTYVFIIPTNIERLLFTYDMLSLNPFVFIVVILQTMVLDDVLLETQQKLDESRVRLT